MKQLDLQVVQQARNWINAGQPVWLCTVLSTFGSAPRGPGAMLVALATGEHCGSLSGGCVEEDFLERIAGGGFNQINQIVRYGEGGLTPTIALPCGGSLDVLIEYLPASAQTAAHLEMMEQALGGHRLASRVVTLDSDLRTVRPATVNDARVQTLDNQVTVRIGAVMRLVIAGLSPVAEFCASFAVAMGYEVIVCDPRPEVIGWFSVPGVQVKEVLPAVFIAEQGSHPGTAIVALTHDPRLDDLTLLEAVRTEAFYIGAMGSQRTSDKRLERLRRIGELDDETLSRIHAPIGLRLGSKTPAEIAIAVIADILRVANGVSRTQL